MNQNNQESVIVSDVPHDHFEMSDSEDEGNSVKYNIPTKDELYNPNGDEEDEAYVYKNLRCGVQENIRVRKLENGNVTDDQKRYALEQAKLMKPRSSDAILSCPCCFTIVCMDCQRHERYKNQFRAMFVMNIGVAWDKHVYPENKDDNEGNDVEEEERHVVKKARNESDRIPNHDDNEINNSAKSDENPFYSVYCNSCSTEVAALDMSDEVYYFFGCLVSA